MALYSCSDGSESSSLVSNAGSVIDETNTEKADEVIEEEAEVKLNGIDLYSTRTSIPVGESVEFIAIGHYSDGSILEITDEMNFVSSDESILTINEHKGSAIAAGSVMVSVNEEGITESIILLPFSAVLTSIEVNSSNLELPSLGTYQLEVTAIYDNGQSVDVTNSASFLSTDSSIASVNTDGLVSGTSVGSSSIIVDFESNTTTVNIRVSAQTIASIQVTPVIGEKAIGDTQSFYATATLSDNSILDITNVCDWQSSDSDILSITDEGIGSMISAGVVSISAEYQGVTSNVDFKVSTKVLTSIELTLSTDTTSIGLVSENTVTGTYNDGSTADITESAIFESSDSTIAIVSNNTLEKGRVTTLSLGTTIITATVNGLSSSKTLTVSNITLVSIRVETANSLLASGINAYFTATGVYSDNSEIDITKIVNWTVSNSSYGSISNISDTKGLYSNTFNGGSTSSMRVTAEYESTSGDINILLAPGSINTISITPTTVTKNTSSTFEYKAYANFSDGASVDISDIVTWQSSDESLALVSNSVADSGTASTLGEGSVSVTALYNGLTSNSSILTVDNGQAETESDDGTGLLASYFSGNNFDNLEGERIDSEINFNWAAGLAPLGVGDNFSVRWQGEIKGKYTGDCTIASRSDDGFRVYLNDILVLDIWFPHAPRWDFNYSVPFVENEKQTIKVEFFENGGHAVAELYWQCPGDTGLEIIPMENLFN